MTFDPALYTGNATEVAAMQVLGVEKGREVMFFHRFIFWFRFFGKCQIIKGEVAGITSIY